MIKLKEKAPIWVNWKYEERNGDLQKMPKNSRTGGNAQSNNPDTWSSYAKAVNERPHFDGVGIMFAKGNDYCLAGVDIDGHGGNNPYAPEILELFKGTYAEKSPSGNGWHIIFYVKTDKVPTQDNGEWDTTYYKKNASNELECYVGGFTSRFFTYTENQVSESDEVTDQTEEFLYFLNTYMIRKKGDNMTQTMDLQTYLDKARKAKNGDRFVALYDNGDISLYNNDDSKADSACVTMIAFWLYKTLGENAIDTAFRQSALYRPKWERDDYRDSTIKGAIEACNGTFYEGVGRPRKDGKPRGESKQKDERERLTIEALADELKEMGIEVSHNVISNSIEVKGYSDIESTEHILSTLPTLIYSELCGKYKGVTQQIISDYILVLATRNRFNPVLELLNSVKWDGKDHLATVYDALCLKEDDELSRTLIKKWFWQGHALLRNNSANPYGADGVLTLAGGQGIGKTSFFRHIALDKAFFREGQSIDNYDKDNKRRCITTWICELGELDCTLKSDMGMLKAFITNAYDEYRLPYGRVDQRNARRTNLAATVNGTKFLIDPSGNRRFWVVELEKIDLDKLKAIDAVQVWAQVWEEYASKDLDGFRLTKAEQADLAERNSQCEKELKGEDEVLDILDKASRDSHYKIMSITVSDFKAKHDTLHNYSVAQIGKVLDKLGYKSEKEYINGKQQRIRKLPVYVYDNGETYLPQ